MSDNLNKHATGPKTPEGKARSAMNAVRHGLTGGTVVLPGEDRKQFDELLENYIHDLRPATSLEMDLVHEIAVCRWRIQRTWAMESNMYEITAERSKAAVASEYKVITDDYRMALAFMKMADEGRAIGLLHRYETRLTRRMHQAMRDLEHLQIQRKADEREAEKQICQTNSRKPAPPDKLAPVVTILSSKPDGALAKRPPNGLDSPHPRDSSPEVKPA